MNSPSELDIGPLSWVKDEIELALGRTSEALQAHASRHEEERLVEARSHLHQAHGALSIVGLDGVTEFSHAIERLLDAVVTGETPWSAALADTAQQGLSTLRQYLGELVAGRPNQPLRLLPVYRRLAEARGVRDIPASDLFFPDLTQRPPRRSSESAALDQAAMQARLKAARLGFERGLAKWLRDETRSENAGVRDMRNSIAIIESLQTQPSARTFWWVTLAFFDALAAGGIRDDEGTRQLCTRIDAQVRKLLDGAEAVAERLLRDVLYEVAIAPVSNEHIDLVRAVYRLRDLIPAAAADDQREIALQEMRQLVGAANESWSQFCAGAAIALPRFHEQSAQLQTLAQKLGHTDFSRLVSVLANCANQLRKNPLLHSEQMAVDVATALLLADSAVNQFATLGNEFAAQVDAIAGRINALQRGETVPPHALPRLAELAQRAGERLAVHQGMRELHPLLVTIEQALDAFFRDPAAGAVLDSLAEPLQQIGAMFAGLGQGRATEITQECARRIAELAAPGHKVESGEFEEIARKISALGFFVGQLQRGPADLDAILTPQVPAPVEASPSVEAEMSQMTRMARTLVGALRDAPEDETVRESLRSELKQNLQNVRDSARLVADTEIEHQAAAALQVLETGSTTEQIAAAVSPLDPGGVESNAALGQPQVPATETADVDGELVGFFIEEVLQILDTIGVQLFRSLANPENREHMVVIRRCFHTLKGSSRMVGLTDFSVAAQAVEAVLNHHLEQDRPASPELHAMIDTAQHIISDWVERLQRHASPPNTAPLLRQCEALNSLDAELVPVPPPGSTRLSPPNDVAPPVAAAEPPAAPLVAAPAAAKSGTAVSGDAANDFVPLFLEESEDLVAAVATGFRAWRDGRPEGAESLQRLLHTLKGSARMAGMNAIGAAFHDIETRISDAVTGGVATPSLIDELEAVFDQAAAAIDALRGVPERDGEAPRAVLRVHADLVDALVNESGEIAIERSRIEGGVKTLRASLGDLTENVERLRSQLRELEIQAELRMQSKHGQAQEHEFDPLEMDRFTRLQELTRMMAESVNDVATVESSLMRDLDQVDVALTLQARLSRQLSQQLMAVRMVPFASIAERLLRVVRQTAHEAGKDAVLTITGGDTELDRSVLERMTAPIEHLLRNAVVHGIEAPAARHAAGKAPRGTLTLALMQAGNEVVISAGDDGAGLDYQRIRSEAVKRGLLTRDQPADEERLAQFIYQPGFTTTTQLSAIAGRGIGMDVVRSETTALGGRLDVRAQPGLGTTFTLRLPLTQAIVPTLLVKCGNRRYAIPSSMVVQANELKPEAMVQLRATGEVEWETQRYPLYYLPRLLGEPDAQPQPQRRHWVVLLSAGVQRLALEVDDLAGNEEAVVKRVGPQLARVVGISGATVLGDGEIVLILNPVALANRGNALAVTEGLPLPAAAPPVASEVATPIVMVVDDSLTVRKITSRFLDRAGYRVILAKDGIDALEQLAEALPGVILADIEMPRMDGFDLVRAIRADARLKHLPVIMITSRIADKHRNYAAELGVSHYLGKPYDEEALLGLIARHIAK